MSTEEVWARRANPFTVWSRLATLPLFALALWSRQWFDPWFLVALVVLLLWSIAAPRVVPPPSSTGSWVSRATFGERIRAAKDRWEVDSGLKQVITVLAIAGSLGTIIMVSGALLYDPLLAIGGGVLMLAAKLTYFDRSARLYDEVAQEDPEVRDWVR
jgi:hypothetical protein